MELAISIFSTITTIIFAYLAFRRNGNKDLEIKAKQDGELFSDLAHIKLSIDRIEKKLDKVEFNYASLNERIIKLEQRLEVLEER